MQLMQYLICVAARHEQAKQEYEDELREVRSRVRNQKGRKRKTDATFEHEEELLEDVIFSVKGRPDCLKKLSLHAIATFAYVIKAKVANELYVEGYEVLEKLVCDPECTIDYLNSLGELSEHGWVRIIETQGSGFTDQPPFSWLQSTIDLGDAFHKEVGTTLRTISFASNDDYLDSVFGYLKQLTEERSTRYQLTDPKTDLATFELDGWLRQIGMRVSASTCPLPAAEAKDKYSLSIFQYLTLIGLLAKQDDDLDYDFNDPHDVARLFAAGRVCRKLMKDHLFGSNSRLKKQRLLEGARGDFGDTIRLTSLGMKALLGKQPDIDMAKELKNRIKKTTLFDYEEPSVKNGSVILPPPTTEAIQSLLFSESKEGKKIRQLWHESLPAACGAPTGSTVLLYGPPGTGKTLTAQYLASELKQPLLKVDASRILSCWIGESEQNVRRIFDDYTTLQKDLGKSPVLLLNEADQLLGSREAGHSGVDRMNNNMQNLFLEGLERFTGIMVATTNRRDLLDEAFSRRFTYKLELPQPDRHLRSEIWKNHLPMERLADDVDIATLADLNLSGGEIRLVIERAVRVLSYRGATAIDNRTLNDIAHEELANRMKKPGSINRIGF